MANAQPPVCLRCARIAIRHCPALRPGHVAVRAHSTVAAVTGVLYFPGQPAPKMVGLRTVTFEDPTIHWVAASQLIRELHDSKVVDLP
jgi:hypothetical protein